MTENNGSLLFLERLRSIRRAAAEYFVQATRAVSAADEYARRADQWELLPEPLRQTSGELSSSLAEYAKVLGPAIRRSPLLTEADERGAGHAIKGMRAALRMRQFRYWDPEILHDEGTVLGVQPASEDNQPVAISDATTLFEMWATDLERRVELMNPEPGGERTSGFVEAKPIAAGYRPGTAFIMMWMSKRHPELIDLSNTVKRCFDRFGVSAVRSDDIEHEDVITERILDQIKTAEFLFADLTGERPSVYYEVGYAHALGRRVILFRKTGTEIHFDLVAYNCPEYQNLAELEGMLTKRLEYVTGRRPKHG